MTDNQPAPKDHTDTTAQSAPNGEHTAVLTATVPPAAKILFVVLGFLAVVSATAALWISGIIAGGDPEPSAQPESQPQSAQPANAAQSAEEAQSASASPKPAEPAKPKLPTIADLQNISVQVPVLPFVRQEPNVVPGVEVLGGGVAKIQLADGAFISGDGGDRVEVESVQPITNGAAHGILVHFLHSRGNEQWPGSILVAYSPDMEMKGFLVQRSQEMVSFAPSIGGAFYFTDIDVVENTIRFDADNLPLWNRSGSWPCPDCTLSVGITAAWDGEHLNLQNATYRDGEREFELVTVDQVKRVVAMIRQRQDSEARPYFTDEAWVDWDARLGYHGGGPSHREISFNPLMMVWECSLIQPSEGGSYEFKFAGRWVNHYYKDTLPGDMACALVSVEQPDVLTAVLTVRPGTDGNFTIVHFGPYYG